MSDNLIVDDINLSGRVIEVREASGYVSIQRSRLYEELSANPVADEYVQAFLLNVFVNLISCSTGDVPKTWDEFLSMREADIEAWTSAARKLNPHWFAWLDNAERVIGELTSEMISELPVEQKQKKKRTRTKS